MAVTQVTFDPTMWVQTHTDGTAPGNNGYDAGTIYADLDGTTFWAFEAYGSGFARVNWSDGSIVNQGREFGSIFGLQENFNTYQRVLWAQDSTNHYFAIGVSTVYRFHIDPTSGIAGSILDGYDVTDDTFDLSSISLRGNEVQGLVAFTNGGTRYLGLIGNDSYQMVVLEADTLTLVGVYVGSGSYNSIGNLFADNTGVLWGLFASGSDNALVRWSSADGVTGSALNVTIQAIPQSLTDLSSVAGVAGYLSTSNSVLLAETWTTLGSDVSVVSMDTWTQTAFHADDSMFFLEEYPDANQGSLDNGEQGGQLMIQGQPASDQTGGVLEIIDPATLSIVSSNNVTQIVNASGVPTSISTSTPVAGFAWNKALGKVAVCYGPGENGSPVYIVDLSSGPPVIHGGGSGTDYGSSWGADSLWVPRTTTATYSATKYGQWSRGPITSEASFSMASNVMELTCVPQQGTLFPGTPTGILNAALNGLFDGCKILVQTVYMPLDQFGNVIASGGVETKFYGQISSPTEISRNKVKFECADFNFLLNEKVPTRILQSNCMWGFADANCGKNAADYTVTFTAATGSTGWELLPASAFANPAGYYTQGVVKCLTGGNAGLSQAVKLHTSDGKLQVMYPWIFPVVPGDTFSVISGCDKSLTTCAQKYNNQIRFGGTPFVPPPQSAL